MPSLAPTPTPQASAEPGYNASMAVGGNSGGIISIVNTNLIQLAAVTMSLLVVIGGVAYYMSDRGRVPPEMPKEPSRDDIYGMVLGESRKRARKPKQ
jgi:hypothetical protein